ncbi:Riboflavin transport system permease protein RibX [Paenibacillus plantiphilus]|uniref:Riboflavin transport system permease protein RibX n=1 Tax=Paenibacillus plantiphilus TaxID=2905650 RepID=A0ABN8H7B5_9BACL|nr:ABC transporter permease [Paenibacillus plantiphilus]CAH1224775.1 Riboflavin transport system permease protein RibX [Paenibacillus plantiphilus]
MITAVEERQAGTEAYEAVKQVKMKMKRRKLKGYTPPVLLFLFILVLWQSSNKLFGIEPYLLPAPTKIVQAIIDNFSSLMQASYMTFIASMGGFALSIVVGVLVAIFMAQSKVVERSIYPYAVVLQTVPVVSIAPIIIVWMGPGLNSILLISFIVSVFPIITNTLTGLLSTEHNLVNLMSLYRASWWQKLWRLRIPFATPYILTGMKISSGAAVIGTIVGEYQAGIGGSDGGLGYVITVAATQLRMDYLFAAAIVSCVMGFMVFILVNMISNLVLRNWHESSIEMEN